MGIKSKILIMVLITLTLGEARDDMEIMKEMMVELKKDMMEMRNIMSEHLSVSEEKMAKAEIELKEALIDMASTKEDLEKAKIDLTAALSDLLTFKDDFISTKTDLVTVKADLMTKVDDLEREVVILSDPPYLHICASHNEYLYIDDQTIPYTSLLSSSTNTEGGWLEMTKGVFTAPVSGTYTVTWATMASLNTGERLEIYLQKIGDNILQSEHYSQYTGDSGISADQGGRTMLVYLCPGDTLSLYCHDCSPAGVGHTSLCVSLTTSYVV